MTRPPSRRSPLGLLILALSLAVNVALAAPVFGNEYLRWQYQRTLAIWAAHVRPPSYVFIGDSITAGGRTFGRLDSINLGSSGLNTAQVAGALGQARGYHPRHIVIMAGTNDAVEGAIDEAALRRTWAGLVQEPRVVVFLPPPTRDPAINARLARINAIAAQAARAAGRPVYALPELRGPDGLLRPQFSVDGVHLAVPAYAYWKARLD